MAAHETSLIDLANSPSADRCRNRWDINDVSVVANAHRVPNRPVDSNNVLQNSMDKVDAELSPSQTTLKSRASNSFGQTNVASYCARLNSLWSTTQGAQSYSGSANHDGLGKLPATEVFRSVIDLASRRYGRFSD